MTLKRLFQEIDRGLDRAAYLVFIEDSFLQAEIIRRLKARVAESMREVSFVVYDLESSDQKITLREIVDELNTPGFLGTRKTVIIRGLHRMPKKELENLLQYLEQPSEINVLFMLSSKTLKTHPESFKNCKVFSLDFKGPHVYTYIKEVARAKGVSLSEKEIRMLAVVSGSDAGIINSEIEKIRLLKDQDRDSSVLSRTKTDIRHLAFNLADAVIQKDRYRAFSILSQYAGSLDPIMTIGAFNWAINEARRKGLVNEEYSRRAFKLLLTADIEAKKLASAYPLEDIVFRLLLL